MKQEEIQRIKAESEQYLNGYEERKKELKPSICIAEDAYLVAVDEINEKRNQYNETLDKANSAFEEWVLKNTKVRGVLSHALAVDLLIWLSSVAVKKVFLHDRQGLTIIDATILLTFYSFVFEVAIMAAVSTVLELKEKYKPDGDKLIEIDAGGVILRVENRNAVVDKSQEKNSKPVEYKTEEEIIADLEKSIEVLKQTEIKNAGYRDSLKKGIDDLKAEGVDLKECTECLQKSIETQNRNILKVENGLSVSRVFALFTHAGVIDLAVKVLGAQNCMAGQSIYIPMLSILLQSYVERCADKADVSALRQTEWKCLNTFNAISCAHSAALLYYGASGIDAIKPMVFQASIMLTYRLVCDDEAKLEFRV